MLSVDIMRPRGTIVVPVSEAGVSDGMYSDGRVAGRVSPAVRGAECGRVVRVGTLFVCSLCFG